MKRGAVVQSVDGLWESLKAKLTSAGLMSLECVRRAVSAQKASPGTSGLVLSSAI